MHRLIMTNSTTGTLDSDYNLACVPPSTVTGAGNIVRSIVFDDLGSIYFAGADYSTSDVFCFNKGTKILCMNQPLEDEYIPIENLNIGDFVKTYKHGYRKVSRVVYEQPQEMEHVYVQNGQNRIERAYQRFNRHRRPFASRKQ